jgi:hypothetical protein
MAHLLLGFALTAPISRQKLNIENLKPWSKEVAEKPLCG